MLGSRGTRVRLTIAVSASFVVAAFFLSRGDAPLGSATPPDASESAIAAVASEAVDAARRPGDRQATAATPAAEGVGSHSELSHASAAAPTLSRWARDALEVDDDAAGRAETNRDPSFTGGGLNPQHLAALADIIAASQLSESSSPFDYDDGNGVLDPWELGFQVWENGSLVLLAMGPTPDFSFGYRHLSLPESMGDLNSVRVLALHGSELKQLPDSIGMLEALRELRLHDNQLSELPRSIQYLWQLRELHLGANYLLSLPSELGFLDSLEILNASDNPLLWIEDGALAQPRLRVLALERTRRPQRPGTPAWGQLRELPDEVASLSLEELRIGGNLLYCVGGPPASHLTNGSIASVVGLSAQRCGSIQ